jgi:zinc protease
VKRAITLITCLLLAAAVHAQQVTSPPPPAAPRPMNLPKPVEKTLANGLRVIVISKHDVPLVSARLMVKAGSEEDPAGMAGLAKLTASLVTQGTKTRSAEQIARGVEALGATLAADAGWDESDIDLSVMSTNFMKAMEFMADVARNPSFRAEEIDRLRAQSIDSVRVALQEPRLLARFVAARVVFQDTPYGHIVGGTPESLEAIGRENIVNFHSRYYRPENAVLVVAGDVKAPDVFTTAEKLLGTWKRRDSVTVTLKRTGENKAPEPRVVVIDMPEAGQAAVVVTRRGLSRVDPSYYPALVTNSILGGGYSARLNQEIRIKRGLSYGASSFFEMRRDAGPFIAATQTKNESAAEVAGIIVDELNRLGNLDVVEAEMTPRKAVLIGGFGRSLETSGGMVDRVSALALYGLPLEEVNRYIPGVQKVTAANVRQFASSNLLGSSASIVIVGDAKLFIEPLRKRFPGAEVVPVAELNLNAATLRTAAK